MDLDQVAAAINERTRAIVATHLFGYPLDCDRLAEIVRDAESRVGHRIYVIHDCAHSFGAKWRGRLVTAEGDAAMFGLGISKLMTSIFGGMLTTSDEGLASRLRAYRDTAFRPSGALKGFSRGVYLVASRAAFSAPAYPFVHWLEHETSLLDQMTKAYHLDDLIHFPPDHVDRMTDVEARVGLVQLRKYPEIVAAHVAHAEFYDRRLRGATPWELPPIVAGATYSHYVVRVPDRAAVIRRLLREGIELGELIQYSVPHMPAYRSEATAAQFPNSRLASMQTINVPVYAGLRDDDRERIASALVAASVEGTSEDHAFAAG
jgi:dTDP-4-amino-4,6-dideoxygalactose transaminase